MTSIWADCGHDAQATVVGEYLPSRYRFCCISHFRKPVMIMVVANRGPIECTHFGEQVCCMSHFGKVGDTRGRGESCPSVNDIDHNQHSLRPSNGILWSDYSIEGYHIIEICHNN
jgi:hypothetical protein